MSPAPQLLGPAIHKAIGVVINRGVQLDSPLRALSAVEIEKAGAIEDCRLDNPTAVARSVAFLFEALRCDIMTKTFIVSVTSIYHRKGLNRRVRFTKGDIRGALNQLSERQRYLLGHLVEMTTVLHNYSLGRLTVKGVAGAMAEAVLMEKSEDFKRIYADAFFTFFASLLKVEAVMVPEPWRSCKLCDYQTKLFEVTLSTLEVRIGSPVPPLIHELIAYLLDEVSSLDSHCNEDASLGYVNLRREIKIDAHLSAYREIMQPKLGLQLLTDFIKRLPNPLLPIELMLKRLGGAEYKVNESSVLDVLDKLPVENKIMLGHLMQLMREIAECDNNNFDCHSVAVHFTICLTQSKCRGWDDRTIRAFVGEERRGNRNVRIGLGTQFVLYLMQDAALFRNYRLCSGCDTGKLLG